ncbi:single-stranded DNA-binding protein [Clostridium beijerinckii]|uniref:Single-stranded DNA-binding protein n=1 Tax=Clostridium beijerinckii TaxID=1520 RepID=A0A7X9XNJ3_CLOBE|nr:single-stranded DNA-binding protein [Clostridium beijerinckii]NMF04547.1 single-stranded DNA-binding protein [Clostridium beijerinckii]
MNKWVGIGRLTKDSELKFTAGKGTANLTFTLAVDDGFGDNKKTYFIPIVLWGKSAESLSSYLVKGTQIGVIGKIQTRSYDAKDGTKRYVTEVVADQFSGVEFLGSKGKNNEQSMPVDAFGGGFEEDITPVDDGDMPF